MQLEYILCNGGSYRFAFELSNFDEFFSSTINLQIIFKTFLQLAPLLVPLTYIITILFSTRCVTHNKFLYS